MSFTDQFCGLVKETTWGDDAAPPARTEFHRIYPGSFGKQLKPRTPFGYLGQEPDPSAMFDQISSADVNVRIPLVYKPIGVFFRMAFGKDPVDSTPAGTDGEYTHDYVLDPDFDDSFVVETHLGLPEATKEGTLSVGVKSKGWGLIAKAGEEVILEFQGSGKQADLAAKTGAPSPYPDYALHTAIPAQIIVEVDDVATSVLDASFTVNPTLKHDRAFLGSAAISEQKRAAGFREIVGTLAKEWENRTLYDKFLSGATAKLEVICTGPLIAGSSFFFAHFTLGAIVFTGETPEPGEGGITEQSLPWRALHVATDTALKLQLMDDVATA